MDTSIEVHVLTASMAGHAQGDNTVSSSYIPFNQIK